MKRRALLGLVGGALAPAAAGCGDDGGAATPLPGEGESGWPGGITDTPATATLPADHGSLRLRNDDDAHHRLSVAVTTDGETLLDDWRGLQAGEATVLARNVAPPDSYAVAVAVDDGPTRRFGWTVAGDAQDLVVRVTPAGNLDRRRRVECDPRCTPGTIDGRAESYPLGSSDGPPARARATLRAVDGAAAPVTLSLSRDGTEVFRYTYRCSPARTVVVPRLADGGTYGVTATTPDGREGMLYWRAVRDAWLRVRLTPEALRVGCGEDEPVTVAVENERGGRQTVSLALLDGERRVDDRTVGVPAGERRQVELLAPFGDRYALRVETADASVERDVVACHCLRERPTVTLSEAIAVTGGPSECA